MVDNYPWARGWLTITKTNCSLSLFRDIQTNPLEMTDTNTTTINVTILYATETGKSEEYSRSLNELFQSSFNSKVVCMDDYNFVDIMNEQCLLIVTSTFGNGEAPDNGLVSTKHSVKYC